MDSVDPHWNFLSVKVIGKSDDASFDSMSRCSTACGFYAFVFSALPIEDTGGEQTVSRSPREQSVTVAKVTMLLQHVHHTFLQAHTPGLCQNSYLPDASQP